MPRERLRRTAPLARFVARATGEAALTALRRRLREERSVESHLRAAERYAQLFGESKGALMKAAQMFSYAAIRFAVPLELQTIYQSAFERLLDDAPPMAPALARAVVEHELGERLDAAFAAFEPEPLAAASIGQVHAARLHDGREVAVKVQYPGVAEAIRADLANAELLASFLTFAIGAMFPRGQRLDLRNAAREIGARIEEELDYQLEASRQSGFAEHYRGHPFIRVPNVIDELSTPRVLTQELMRGLSWKEALTAEQALRDQWAEAIHRFLYGSMYRLQRLNADPHPGNFLFHDDGSVTCLDFGSVKQFEVEHALMLRAIFRECLRNDVLGTWRASVEAGAWSSSDPVTPEEAFAYWHGDNALVWASGRFVATPGYVAKGIARRYSPIGPSSNALRHLRLPPELALMVRIEIALTSLIGRLRAGNDWASFAAEYCEDAEPVTEMGKRERAFFDRREKERVAEAEAR
ncbi:MAG TPA: AarF/ABC1/UbiB kinase family protein [Solirubrobacteraceae bacterium]|nr:AarF/ABC1/UbiB kinase family protein [Solirubrobacteraceae bacterium]